MSEITQQSATLYTTNQEYYVDYVASGGLSIDEEGVVKKVTVGDFTASIGVDRTTAYRWQKLPGFWEKVNERRQYFLDKRISHIYNALTFKAINGKDVAAAKLLLQQAGQLKAEKVESKSEVVHTVGYNFGTPIQGEIVGTSAQPTDNPTA